MRSITISSIAFLGLLVFACQDTVTSPDELAFAEGGTQAMAGGTQGSGQRNWPDCTATRVMVNQWHGVVDGLLVKQVGDVTYVNVCGVITHDKAGTGREGGRFGIAIEDSPAGDRQIKRPWIDCADPENPISGPPSGTLCTRATSGLT